MSNGSKLLVALNLLGAMISLLLLLATWFAKGAIVDHARQVALEKTRAFVDPVIPGAEKLLEQSLVAKALPPGVKAKLAEEIATYQESPNSWLLTIADNTRDRASEFEFPEVRNPLARKSLDFITKRLAGAREHFQNSFANLIRDLRIFAFTNLSVFLTAAVLCFISKNPESRYWLTAWSVLLFVVTVISIAIYANQSWVWNVVWNRYEGWAYAGTHLVATAYLGTRVLTPPSRKTVTDNPQLTR
jgi:hypothetical protein